MNETTREQLSALMDGELPRDEIRFLLRGPDRDAAAQRWARYQIARAVLRQEFVPVSVDDGFATAVMMRLDPQPARGARLVRWAGGGAIAAAVALVALVATRPAGENGALPGPSPSSLVLTQPLPAQPPLLQQQFRQPMGAPQQAMPASFADFAQPASFESLLPSYAGAPRATTGNEAANGLVPYILVVGSRAKPEVQTPEAPESSSPRQ